MTNKTDDPWLKRLRDKYVGLSFGVSPKRRYQMTDNTDDLIARCDEALGRDCVECIGFEWGIDLIHDLRDALKQSRAATKPKEKSQMTDRLMRERLIKAMLQELWPGLDWEHQPMADYKRNLGRRGSRAIDAVLRELLALLEYRTPAPSIDRAEIQRIITQGGRDETRDTAYPSSG